MNKQRFTTYGGDMNMRTDSLWIGLVLLTTALSVSTLVPRTVGYALVAMVYLVLGAYLLIYDRLSIVYHWAVGPMVVLIWFMFGLTTALDPTVAGIIRLGAFTVITGINLFAIPAALDSGGFHEAVAVLCGVLVLIGLPTVFVGSYSVLGIAITPWHTTHELFGVTLHSMKSVFGNPNTMTYFAALGTIAAGAAYARIPRGLAVGLVVLNALGVYLAGGRAGMLALVVAVMLYVTYRFLGRTATAVLVAVGAVAVLVGFGVVFGVVPGPSAIARIDLTGRRMLWEAAYEAIRDRPMIGWGPGHDKAILAEYTADSAGVHGTHNSYLRVFLLGGVLAGVSYLLVTVTAIAIGVRNARSETLFTFLMLVAFGVLQIFSARTIFGLSLLSTTGALALGYAQSSSDSSRRVKFGTPKLLRGWLR